MKTLSFFVGLCAVALYLLCFQLKNAKSIIACKLISSILYVTQYLLLFAFVGAAMDAAATVTSAFAYRKDTPFVRKYKLPILIFTNLGIVTMGLLLYENFFSLFAVAGVMFESAANWMKKEQAIRIVSLFATPCWFTYNVVSGAYGSAIGSFLGFLSIVSSLIRYSSLLDPSPKKTRGRNKRDKSFR